MTNPPSSEPIGLHVARVAKSLNRAFEAALSDVGGSLPTWLILLSLKSGRPELSEDDIRAEVAADERELERRASEFRGDEPA